MMPRALRTMVLLSIASLGCDKWPLGGPNQDADGRAVGGGCRHAGRALSDCYAFHPELPKAAIFAGWREMNDYMLDKKLDTVKPELVAEVPKPRPPEGGSEGEGDGKASDEKERTPPVRDRAIGRPEAKAEPRPEPRPETDSKKAAHH